MTPPVQPTDSNSPPLENQPSADTTSHTNTPPIPEDNGRLLTFYAEQARAAREESSRLNQELAIERANANARANQPKPEDYTQYNEALANGRGGEAIAEIVRREVASTIKPIRDDISAFRQRETAISDYSRLKNTYRNLPYFAAIESEVDQLMNNTQPTAQAMDAAIRIVVGNATMTGKSIPGLNTPVNNTPASTTVPAQLPPSAPAAPARVVNGTPVVTETEKRMAAQQHMTIEEYVYLRDMNPSDVVNYKWDKANNRPGV